MDPVSAYIYPEYADFITTHNQGKPQIVYTEYVLDAHTPVTAMQQLLSAGDYGFLLESVHGGEVRGRYSIIGVRPDLLFRCSGSKAEICTDVQSGAFQPCQQQGAAALKALLAHMHIDMPAHLPSAAAGLIGYHGYAMIAQVEDIPQNLHDPINIPDALLMRPTVTLVFDTVDGKVYVCTPVWEAKGSAEQAYADARARLDSVLACLRTPLDVSIVALPATLPALPDFTSNQTEAEFATMVERAKEYIKSGDIFQIVLSQRFKTAYTLPAFALYRALRHLNPSPFLFYLCLGDFTLVGSSPEILVRLKDGKITIRPIAGTRKRGATVEDDKRLEQELLADPKELAEHLMLLDLGRNDAGRCAVPGSVRVREQMQVERYSHVMHIVSEVESEHDTRYDAFDVLMSGFPAGTVSGAPKIRAMEIIDELEPEARSFYAGCVGYFSADGSMDTCITLRTGLVKDGKLYVQAGGGIVYDSTPEGEYAESLNKAKALMQAAGMAQYFAASPLPKHKENI